MKLHFVYFSLLWILPLFAAIVAYASLRRVAPRRALLLQSLAGLCAILSAAGLQFQQSARNIQLVVAADISPSIYELNAQTERVRELLSALDPNTTQAAVVVFSESAALERPMSPLPTSNELAQPNPKQPARVKPLPDLAHPNAVIKNNGTDISAALQFARNAFTSSDCSRAILLQSDFRDTRSPDARFSAFLRDSGIEFLATPSILGPSSDVQLAELRLPDVASTTRAVPIDITLAAQQPATVVVTVWRRSTRERPQFVGSQNVTLDAPNNTAGSTTERRKTIRLLDHPNAPGVAVYTATLTGPNGPIPGDVLLNNSLSAAVRIAGPSKWAVLARSKSTLEKLALDPARALGVETTVFTETQLPTDASAYEPFAGILVDGFPATQLPDNSPTLHALTRAVENGKPLVAIGGDSAFGTGGHRTGGDWEKILPIEMTPEDDRARAVLFVIDVSKSMDDKITLNGTSIRKMDFAAEQLQAVRTLRPQDRLGLIEFSGTAALAAPLSNEPTHDAFLKAILAIKIDANTDFVPSLELAKQTLDADDAEEKLVILISDGVDTSRHSRDEILRAAEKLCPKSPDGSRTKTTLWTFGIDVDNASANTVGENLLIDLAARGNGKYSRDFRTLGTQLSTTLEQGKKEFYTRREPFVPRASQPHALIKNTDTWPTLGFRNRVKSKSTSDTILVSGTSDHDPADPANKKSRPDPLLILSGPNATSLARRATLALSLDGNDGAQFLSAISAGRTLLPGVLNWAEARTENEPRGIAISVQPFGNDELAVELRAVDPASGEPENALNPTASFVVLQGAENESSAPDVVLPPLPLRAIAPGTYRGTLRAPPASVCRMTVQSNAQPLAERFVSTPCPAEMRRFGVDRAAMAELVSQAAPSARVIDSPRDLAQWAAEKNSASTRVNLSGWLIGLALVLLLVEYGTRGQTTKIS